MSYNETNPTPKTLDLAKPTEGATTPAEVNNAIREAKRVLKVGSAIITTTGNLQLSEQHSTVLINGAHTVTLPTIANVSSSTFTRRYRIINISASTGVLKTKASGETLNGNNYASTGLNLPNQYKEYLIYGNGTVWYMETNTVFADTISEITAGAEVSFPDDIKVDTIHEIDAGKGVAIDGFGIKDGGPDPASWPSFSVHKNATDQTSVGTALEIITWSTELFDTNSDFASNRFTPTVAGKYLLTATIDFHIDADGDALEVSVYKNGAELNTTKGIAAGPGLQAIVIVVIADANGSTDYFEIYAANRTTADTVEGDRQRTFFMGSRIA